jgi:hypothetical protein
MRQQPLPIRTPDRTPKMVYNKSVGESLCASQFSAVRVCCAHELTEETLSVHINLIWCV